METKPQDALAILKLYEIRSEPLMRTARSWFFSEFNPQSGMDILALIQSGEKQSAWANVTEYQFINHQQAGRKDKRQGRHRDVLSQKKSFAINWRKNQRAHSGVFKSELITEQAGQD